MIDSLLIAVHAFVNLNQEKIKTFEQKVIYKYLEIKEAVDHKGKIKES